MQGMEIDLGLLLDTIPGLAWTALPDGRAEYVGKQWLEYTGLTFEQTLDAGWIEAVHPDDIPRLLSRWAEIIASGQLGEVEARLRRHDGAFRWFLFRACPMPSPSGEVTRWCGINFDIDDRVRAEAESRGHRRRFERILEGLPVIAGLFATDGRIIFCNRRMLDFLGGTLEEIQAAPWVFTHHPDDRDEVRAAWQTAIQLGQAYDREARLLRWDGVYRWHRMMVSPLRNEAGEIDVWYGVANDIDEARQAQAMLAAEKRLLERVAKGVPLPVVLDELARAVEALAPGCYCTILMVDESGEHFKIGAAPTLPDGYKAILDGKDIDPNYGPLSRSIFEKAPIIVGDAANDPRWARSAWPARMKAHGLHSSWTAPILAADGASLAAFAIYRREPQIPTPQEQELIDRFTHIAGIAIERAHADAALKASEDKLASEKHLLQLVATGVPLSEVLDAVCREVDAFASGSVCAITVTDTDSKVFGPSTTPGMPEGYKPLIEGKAIEPDYGPSAFAVANRTTVVAADLANDPRWAQSIVPQALERLGIRSCWATPIMSAGGIPLGALAAYCRERRSPNEGEVELIERFAHIAGIAIERERAEAALRESEAKVRRAYDSLAEAQRLSLTGSFVTDLLAEEHDWSEESYRIFGFDRDAALSVEGIRTTVHPDDRSGFDAMIARAGGGEDVDFTFRIFTPQGVMKHVRGVARVIERVEGRPLFVGALQDVTQSKLVEEALRANEAELLQAYAHLNEAQTLSRTGSFTWDVERDEHNWSAEERRIWEFGLDAKITMTMILEAIHPDDLPLAERVIGNALHEDSFEVVLRIITRSGLLKHVHVVGRRAKDITDRVVFLGAIQDITERKTAEEALNRARAELAHVSRAMTVSALTASIAHEVNQPLAGIITNANTGLRMLAADPPNLDGLRATMQRTLRDGNRASEVIQRLRAMFSRQSPGLECVDLNDAAREVLAMSAGDLQRRRVVPTTDFADGLPAISGDRVQLQQVILNLVLNAADAMSDIEDRPRGLRLTTVREGPNHVRLSVQDSGVGIEPERVEQLFNAFYTTKPDGMGIGLAISRTIIENHEGRLWASPGKDGPGAIFSFCIPTQRAPGDRPEPQSHPEETALAE